MTEWSGGYVTDIEYSRFFRREQAPSHLDLVCLINGVARPEPTDRVRYCDLGCGSGYTASLLAAANPEIEFWGVDFNPAHIAEARAFQVQTGLTNINFLEHAFDDLVGAAAPALPQFDYVTLHGVYTWVGPEARQAIIRFLSAYLKPGGLVYLGYNALPAWTPELPFQRALAIHSRATRERSDRAVVKAFDFVKRVRDAGARELDRPRVFEKFDELVAAGRERYLAHEYLTTQWSPMYHEDVARDMSAAKLDYVGSSVILQNFAQLCLSEEQREICQEIGGSAGETLKDYFLGRTFRTDVYVRGRRGLTTAQRHRALRAVKLGLLVPFADVQLQLAVPLGKSQLNERLYRPIFGALQRAPMGIGDLLDLPEIAGFGADPVEVAGMLVGTNQAIAVTPSIDEAALQHTRRFNAAVAARAIEDGDRAPAFALAAAGSGIFLTQLQTVILDQLISGGERGAEALAASVAGELTRRGTVLTAGGKALESEAATRDALREEITLALAQWLPLWRQLGVL